jgi:hypothetical protein
MKRTSTTAPPAEGRPRPHLPRRAATRPFLGAGLALGLLVCGALTAGACVAPGSPIAPLSAYNPAPSPVVVGTVATVTTSPADSFTLTSFKGVTWTVTVTASTAYMERGVASAGFSNVTTGVKVRVFGASTGTDLVTATKVVIVQKPVVVGTVASVATTPADTFTLTAWKGATWTVTVTTATTYAERGVTSPGFSNLAVGDQAVVYGTSTGTDLATATSVVIIQRSVVVGTVASAPGSGDTFTVTACKGQTWTVTVTGSTTYTERGVSAPTLADVLVGDQAAVYGTVTGSDAVTASSVIITDRAVVMGTVASVTTTPADSITVTAWKSQTVTVDVTSSTTYTERGVSSPTFSDIAVGDQVVVYGATTATATVTATSVVIMQVPVVCGKVASVGGPGGSFTVTGSKGQTWTVDVSGATTYTERGVSAPTLSSVAVGDQVEVYGTSTATNTVEAGNVVIVSCPSHAPAASPSPWAVRQHSSSQPSMAGWYQGTGENPGRGPSTSPGGHGQGGFGGSGH